MRRINIPANEEYRCTERHDAMPTYQNPGE